jgi:hypothetical protein
MSTRRDPSVDDPYGFRHHFADVNDIRMHYVDEGEGPQVVLLHGYPFLTHRTADRRALRADPTAAPTARCRTASTRQAARRRSSEGRAAAHGGARDRACPVRHRVAGPSRRVQPAHASCAGPPWNAGALLPFGKAMPWEPAPAAIGYPFGGTRIRAGLSSRGAVPDPQAEGDARRPAGGRGPIRQAARREAVPWGALGNHGTVRPPAWLPDQLPG